MKGIQLVAGTLIIGALDDSMLVQAGKKFYVPSENVVNKLTQIEVNRMQLKYYNNQVNNQPSNGDVKTFDDDDFDFVDYEEEETKVDQQELDYLKRLNDMFS